MKQCVNMNFIQVMGQIQKVQAYKCMYSVPVRDALHKDMIKIITQHKSDQAFKSSRERIFHTLCIVLFNQSVVGFIVVQNFGYKTAC